ncbi:MAG: serine/threonine-protein phosphatase, partial [Spirochaetia bacterium]|nr:serine/threonine-protein phosphatase [Spirochaetia bacterium]
INQISIDFFSDTQFATFIVLILDQHSGTVEFCGAGSPPILVYRHKRQEIEEIHPKGIPVGIMEDYIFSQSRFELGKGDTILMFTDGAYECENWSGEFYGMERILNTFHKNAKRNAFKIIKKMISNLKWFTKLKSRNDDTTYIAIKRLLIKKKRK